MAGVGRALTKFVLGATVLGGMSLASGCGNFFQCEGKASCGDSSATGSDDVVFAGNQLSTDLYAYTVGSGGTLTAVSSSATSLTTAPTAMAVTPDNSLLYVAETAGSIYSYVVSTTGVLSNAAQQSTATVQTASMAVSPDGQWLMALDYSTVGATTSPYLRVYQIGTSGTLSSAGTGFVAVPNNSSQTVVTYQVAFSADGKYLAVALGPAGTLLYSFNTSDASFGAQIALDGGSSSPSDNGVVFDSNDNLYVAHSGTSNGIAVFTAPITSGSTSTSYDTGGGPRMPIFASKDAFLYTANIGANTITASSVSSSYALTTIGTDVSAPTLVQALVVDNSGKYLLAGGTDAGAGLQSYTIGTSGGLTADKTAATGSVNGVPVLAVTH